MTVGLVQSNCEEDRTSRTVCGTLSDGSLKPRPETAITLRR
jgi:hypothetical protein